MITNQHAANLPCLAKRLDKEMTMDENSITDDDKIIHDLKDELPDNAENNQEVIVVDGRSYENGSIAKDVYTLVDVIEDHQIGDKIYEDILKRADEIVERIVRRIVPEIAERVIREEIEKIKNEPS